MRLLLPLLPVLVLGLSSAAPALLAATVKPNVVLIVADDLGYRDVGFNGSTEIATPHLDKLAATGIRCTSGYVSHSFCSPTRAGLLTGRYQHRFGHENNPPWSPESTLDGLPVDQVTIADLLREAGYRTGMVGKWHLGAHPRFHPDRRGFDEYFSALGGGHQYFPNDKGGAEYTIPLRRDGQETPHTKYLTTQFGEEAAAFVKRQTRAERPWLLYLAFNAPHTPLQAPPEWLRKYNHLTDPNRRTYAAMVSAMDAAVGEVTAALDASGARQNTIVLFISDNGGPHLSSRGLTDFTDNSPLRGAKGQVYEGGARVPFLVSWPARLKPGTYANPVTALDFLPTLVAAAGGKLPADRAFDGIDFIPYLAGEKTGEPHPLLYWRRGGPGADYAVRRGDWKLVRLGPSEAELYNLREDIGEKVNLAAKHPAIVQELTAALTEWEKDMIAPIFEGPRKQPKGKKAPKGKAQPRRTPSGPK